MAPIAGTEPELQNRNARELITFFLLAYGISLVLWFPVLVGRKVSPVFLSLGTGGPTLAALVTHRIFSGNWRAVRFWSTLPNLLIGITAGACAVN